MFREYFQQFNSDPSYNVYNVLNRYNSQPDKVALVHTCIKFDKGLFDVKSVIRYINIQFQSLINYSDENSTTTKLEWKFRNFDEVTVLDLTKEILLKGVNKKKLYHKEERLPSEIFYAICDFDWTNYVEESYLKKVADTVERLRLAIIKFEDYIISKLQNAINYLESDIEVISVISDGHYEHNKKFICTVLMDCEIFLIPAAKTALKVLFQAYEYMIKRFTELCEEFYSS